MKSYKKAYSFFKIYIATIICVVTGLFIFSIYDGEFFPVFEDEAYTYCSAHLYSATNSTKAAICVYESRSVIGEHNYYGPAYHIIYGLIAKIFGFNKTYFITFHYLLFLISVLLLWFLPLNKIKKLIFIAIFLSTYASFTFIFTYYPEMLNILFGIILLLVFSRINSKTNRLVYVFFLLVLLFSIVRVTTVFWIFSIPLFANTKKKRIYYFILSCLGFISVILYIKYFVAPALVTSLSFVHNGEFTLSNIAYMTKNLMINCINNLNYIFLRGNPSIILILLLFVIAVYSIFNNSKKRFWALYKKYVFGILLIIIITMISMIFLYNAQSFYLEKQIAFFIPLLIYSIILFTNKYKLVFFICCFIFLPYSIFKSAEYVANHKAFSHVINDNNEYITNLTKFSNFIQTDKKEVNMLISYNEYGIPNNMTVAILPVSVDKKPLLYTTNLCSIDENDSLKFKRYNKIDIDYILSKDSISLKNVELVKSNPNYFYLYKCK